MPSRYATLANAVARPRHAPRPLSGLPGGPAGLAVFGHRGLSSRFPENTLAAFDACVEAGVGIELDVGTSRDGHLVVLHDETLDRTTDGSGELAAHTLPELRGLDAGGWFGPSFAGERLPTLDEVLARCAGRVPLDVELKTDPDPMPLARRLVGALRRYDAVERVFVTSFDPFVLAAVAEVEPAILRGQVVGTFEGSRLPRWQRAALRRMWFNPVSRPDVIVAESALVTPAFVAACGRRGWPVLAWTVNDRPTADRLRAAGVVGLITDDPDAVALGGPDASAGSPDASAGSPAPPRSR